MSAINLLVLYVSDLAASRKFYELLGLNLIREQHGGTGAVHYAAELSGGTVLELYPATGIVSRVRLGLRVPDPPAAVERLRAAHFTVKRSNLVVDPDGNRVVITGRS